MIIREQYLNDLISFIDQDFVKLLIGVRRSGKSTLLLMVQQHLRAQGVKEDQIITINYESFAFDALRDGVKLHSYIADKIKDVRRYYLFIDEAQEIDEWARAINSLRVTFNVDIFVTGSNSRIFIGEHLTYLAGRYVSFHIYPLSLTELKTFKNIDGWSEKAIYDTFLDGSFPSFVLAPHPEAQQKIMQDLYSSIFERDIILRGRIQNDAIFNRVARIAFENIGNQTSPKKITDTLVSNGYKVSYNTVDNYLAAMVKAYVLYHVPRFDIKGKETLRTNGKYYAVDIGLRDFIVLNKGRNSGFIFENVVFLELRKHGYDVVNGRIGDYKIDFVATKGERVIYVQVSEAINDPNTRKRETMPFTLLNDKYERFLVTQDIYKFPSVHYDHLTLSEFIERL